MSGGRLAGAVCVAFVGLTVVMTWPLAAHLGSQAVPHQDVFFNMWRLEWFAHAVRTAPAHLFDANIFYPERRTLAFSDAMIVEGTVAAPLIWAGVPPVLVHNLMMLGAVAASGAAMFALAFGLTRSRGGALLAGIVFAFAPYRAEHAMHLELQWAMWMPLAFLALHRAIDSGRAGWGVAAGACAALQMLSSIYYGIFLLVFAGIAAACLLMPNRRALTRRTIAGLAAGAVLAAAISGLYARPYKRAHARTGDRPRDEVSQFSATPASYLAATPANLLYGGARAEQAGPERRLFPGAVAVVLAMAGLLLPRRHRYACLYLVLLALAFDGSLGFSGMTFGVLYDHVSVFHGLRALARLGIVVLLCIGLLAAFGYQAIVTRWSPHRRQILLAVLVAALAVEYHTTTALMAYPNAAPLVYRMLAQQPAGVVAEFPVPRLDSLPGDEAEYAFMSIFHWKPLLNGYSGVYPPSYLATLVKLGNFPAEAAFAELHHDGVRYVIVHGSAMSPEQFGRIQLALAERTDLVDLGRFADFEGPAALYGFR